MANIWRNLSLNRARDEKGQSLILVMLLLMLGVMIITPLLGFMGAGFKTGTMYQKRTDELYAADAGVREAILNLKQGTQVPTGNNTSTNLTLLSELSGGVNNKGRTVTVYCLQKSSTGGTYKITSTAVSGPSSNTTIEAWVNTIPFLFDYATISTDTIEVKEGTVINGSVSGDVIPDDREDQVNGRIDEPWDPEDWPFTTNPIFHDYYWVQPGVSNNNLTSTIKINLTPSIGPGYRNGSVTIQNEGSAGLTGTLNGTIYIKGLTSTLTIGQTQKAFTLNLNKQAIYVESTNSQSDSPPRWALDVGPKTTITGSGVIIAEGDINFQPNMNTSPTDYVFLMSVQGEVNFHPGGSGGDFYGSLAGKLNIDLASGITITYTEPPPDLNFPGPEQGIEMNVDIRTWKVKQN